MPARLLTPDPEEVAELEHSEQLEEFFDEIVPLDQIPYDLAKLPLKEAGLPHEEVPQNLGSIFADEEMSTPELPDNLTLAPEFSLPSLPSEPLFAPENNIPFLASKIELDKGNSMDFLDGLITDHESIAQVESDLFSINQKKMPEIPFSSETGLALLRNPEAFAVHKKKCLN